jgi:hypothetical protein
MISSERRSECEPGEERDSGKEGQEPATRKRRWGDELTDKVQTIESEIKGLNQLAASHSVSSYLADLLLQFDRISGEVKHRLQELNHLEAFLVRASSFSNAWPFPSGAVLALVLHSYAHLFHFAPGVVLILFLPRLLCLLLSVCM